VGRRVTADLTAFEPKVMDESKGITSLWPNFCLPWIKGEAALVGEAAKLHRRASSVNAFQPEAKLDLGNRGRYHLAEGWLAMARVPDSVMPANVRMAWTPEPGREKRSAAFPEIVKAYLEPWMNHEAALALIVPDGLGPGPRQELLDAIGSKFRTVYFVPRTVAAALAWCESQAGKECAANALVDPGGRAGKLFVSTTSSDVWEGTVVPVRLEIESGARVLRPVHDRVTMRSELGAIGLARWQPSRIDASVESAESIWESWLGNSEGHVVPANDFARGERLLDCFLQHTWLNSVDGNLGWIPTLNAALLAFELDSPLGWVHVSSFRDDERSPEFAEFAGSPSLLLRPDAFLQAGDRVLDLLEDGHVPYFEALAKVDLCVVGRNQYRDPVALEKPLIEATEVPLGQTYQSPEPIADLSLPAGSVPKVDLFVRSLRGGRESLGRKQVIQHNPQDQPEPISIMAYLDPGRGLARFEVKSETPGVFQTTVRESELESPTQLPKLTFSWPPGSAWVKPYRTFVQAMRAPIRQVVQRQSLGVLTELDLDPVLQGVNKWPTCAELGVNISNEELPGHIGREFVYCGVYPSDIGDQVGDLEPHLEELLDVLNVVFKESNPGDAIRNKVLRISSWTYRHCPENVLTHVRECMKGRRSLRDQELAVAGNCFASEDDYKLFFDAFRSYIQNGVGGSDQGWLRAYRNLARFRADALEFKSLSVARQQTIYRWFESLVKSYARAGGGGSFSYCARLAPHILKRRRFDPSFLASGSVEHQRLRALFRQILDLKQPGYKRTDLKISIALLDEVADLGDLIQIA
jgi:hypothetical protein